MNFVDVSFIGSAVRSSQYPEKFMPEVAFCGRSNVGKSSLLNMLVNRKNIARTSQKPGKTRLINFFEVKNEFRFVDLPGYGYAQVSKAEKEKWHKIIEEYLSTREMLMSIYLLLDIRRNLNSDDLKMINYIKSLNYPLKLILTKADKLSNNQRAKSISDIKKSIETDKVQIFLTSSAKRFGRDDIINDIYIDIQRCTEE